MSRGIGMMVLAHQQLKESEELQAQYEKDRPAWEEQYNVATGGTAGEIGRISEKAISRYERLAEQGLSEEQVRNYQMDIDRGTTSSLAQRGSRRGGLVGIGQLDQSNRDAQLNLLEMDAQTRLQGQYNLAVAAPQYEMMEVQYRNQRNTALESLNLQDIYESRDFGMALKGAAYENWQGGWAQLDEDIMSWMSMGMGGGGGSTGTGAMGGGGGQGGGGASPGNPYSSTAQNSQTRRSLSSGGGNNSQSSFGGYQQNQGGNQGFGGYGSMYGDGSYGGESRLSGSGMNTTGK